MQKTLFNGHSNNCCAYCKLYQCAMTVKQMKAKECLNKHFYHLVKNEEHQIWKQRARAKALRKERKMAIAAMFA